jgi:hypothetical protein
VLDLDATAPAARVDGVQADHAVVPVDERRLARAEVLPGAQELRPGTAHFIHTAVTPEIWEGVDLHDELDLRISPRG